MKKRIFAFGSVLVCLCVAAVGCSKSKSSKKENKKTEVIGIIGAMDVELEALKKEANISKTTTIAAMDFCEGNIGGKNVVIVKCGMGKVNAGICAHTLINEFGCTGIINTGVAGSLDNTLDIGDVVISTDAVQHDFDVSPIGFKQGEIPFTGLYAFPADENLRKLALEAATEVAGDIKAYEGRVCSGDQFIYLKEQKDVITGNFGGMCCEMEGAAVAQACYLNDTPFVIIRAVSDKSDGSATMEYEEFQGAAAAHCVEIVNYMIKNM